MVEAIGGGVEIVAVSTVESGRCIVGVTALFKVEWEGAIVIV